MEHNEITVRVDVKMDVKERRSEFAVYRVGRRGRVFVYMGNCR